MFIIRLQSIGKSISSHTIRQLKFIIPGAAITYVFDTHRVFLGLLTRTDVEGLARSVSSIGFSVNIQALSRLFAIASTGMEGLVIILFLYVLLVPWIHSIEPDVGSFHFSYSRSHILINNQYRSWRDSGILSSVIPILTVAILVGWSLLCFTLGRWSNLGYLQGAVGGEFIIIPVRLYPQSHLCVSASGLYALTFGLLGLLPAPKVHRSWL